MEIVEKIETYKRAQITRYPTRWNNASQLGHPCLRYLVYSRLNWKEKALFDLSAIIRMNEGKRYELQTIKDMQEAGIDVVRTNEPFEWKEYQISGRIDGMVRESHNIEIPFEIKLMFNYYLWQKLQSADDFYTNGKWYYRNYLAQMTIYFLLTNKEQGFFLVGNPGNLPKQLPYQLTYEFGEQLIKKCEIINKCVKNIEYPGRMEYRADVCDRCGFFHICLPDKIMEESEISTNEELEELLNRRGELKPAEAEARKVQGQIDTILGDRKVNLVAGNWAIQYGISYFKKGYTVEGKDVIPRKFIDLRGKKGGEDE